MSTEAMIEQLYAIVILGWSLIRSLFAPLTNRRLGVADFREHYAPDRLPPVAPDERRKLALFGGCIACGNCGDAMDLMLASSRSMPDYDAASISFALISDTDLEKLEKRCPTRVPMREISAFVRAKGAEINALPIKK